MTRTDLIRLIWRKVQSRKYHLRGWPQPPEYWLDMKIDGWYESIIDIGEELLKDEKKPWLKSVINDRHEDAKVRRAIHCKGADSMVEVPGLHNSGLKSVTRRNSNETI